MNIALRVPQMSREEFLDWAEAQNERFEFDGFQPVAMVGGTRTHSQICQNIYFALRSRLAGTGCEPLGADAGVATIGDAVRYPDALVSCTTGPGTDRLIPGVVVVFEVLSPTSDRTDRFDKVIEYRAVGSIRRYVLVEYRFVGLTVLHREPGTEDWTAAVLTGSDTLSMPEIGTEVPLGEIYAEIELIKSQRKVATSLLL
jgi:Uma2 family endonuclease